MNTTMITNLNIHDLANDDTLTMPIEIHVDSNGATAVYDGAPDEWYKDLDALLDAHTVTADDLVEYLSERGDDELARTVALATADDESEPDHATEYLAVCRGYTTADITGDVVLQGGPISAKFMAQNVADAVDHAAEWGSRWNDDASDALDIDPDSATLRADLKAALAGWELAHACNTDHDYDIYQRIA